jgi:hypothetical protein
LIDASSSWRHRGEGEPDISTQRVMKIVRGYTGAYVYRQIETLQRAGMLRLEEMSSEVVILNVAAVGSIRSLLISRSRVRIPTGST